MAVLQIMMPCKQTNKIILCGQAMLFVVGVPVFIYPFFSFVCGVHIFLPPRNRKMHEVAKEIKSFKLQQ